MIDRRHFLGCSAAGLGLYPALSLAAELGNAGPFAPKKGHHPAQADHLIFVFLTGGVSHVDTFDPKPRLKADHGKSVAAVSLRGTSKLPVLGSPFSFRKYGQSGLEVSDLFPHLGGVADELCVLRGLQTDIVEHFQAALAMHTGSSTVPMPSIGSWLSYGLGTFNPNLPAFVVLAEYLPYAGSQNWDSHFLPPVHQGVRVVPGPEPIPDLKPPVTDATLRDLEQAMLRDVNEQHAAVRPGDLGLRARSASFETTRGLMREAPGVFDLAKEDDRTLGLYGLKRGDNTSFAYQCLVARRLVERGVRVVELIDTGAGNNWDSHDDVQLHRPKAARVDQALAGLLSDLKRTGLLAKTLVAVCTEFGRTPWADGPVSKGRNHYAKAFTSLLAGAGVRRGITYGRTDEYGAAVLEHPAHVHDYHATILHLMGIDHTRLTYRYAGRDFRLTDVAGNVLTGVLR